MVVVVAAGVGVALAGSLDSLGTGVRWCQAGKGRGCHP